jgi:hypothetical protein
MESKRSTGSIQPGAQYGRGSHRVPRSLPPPHTIARILVHPWSSSTYVSTSAPRVPSPPVVRGEEAWRVR